MFNNWLGTTKEFMSIIRERKAKCRDRFERIKTNEFFNASINTLELMLETIGNLYSEMINKKNDPEGK